MLPDPVGGELWRDSSLVRRPPTLLPNQLNNQAGRSACRSHSGLASWKPGEAAPRGQLPNVPVAELEKSLATEVVANDTGPEEDDQHDA